MSLIKPNKEISTYLKLALFCQRKKPILSKNDLKPIRREEGFEESVGSSIKMCFPIPD